MTTDAQRRSGRDPHVVLGVPRGADRQQIIRAFHRKARRGGHPDTGGDAQTFDDIIRARDALLDKARAAEGRPRRTRTATPRAADTHRATAGSPTARAADANPRGAGTTTAPTAQPAPKYSPPTRTSKLATATVVLALLGPVFWPVAIVIGHLALRQIKRTGQGGGTLVPVVLFFLYILTLPVLARILSVLLIP
jgi:hypothetical protein